MVDHSASILFIETERGACEADRGSVDVLCGYFYEIVRKRVCVCKESEEVVVEKQPPNI